MLGYLKQIVMTGSKSFRKFHLKYKKQIKIKIQDWKEWVTLERERLKIILNNNVSKEEQYVFIQITGFSFLQVWIVSLLIVL